MRQIKVTYDGKYPCLCHGTLTIEVDGDLVYMEQYRLSSTGSCNWREGKTTEGSLIWEDASKFDKDIQEAVEEELNNYRPCCGGCI